MFSIKNLIFFFLIFLNASFKSINAHEIYKDYCNPELYTDEGPEQTPKAPQSTKNKIN